MATADELAAHLAANDKSLNEFFLLVMGALVLFMQCGFAFLEAGAVRAKNVTNILIKNVLDCFLGAVIYWAVGFAFAYGDTVPENGFIGHKYFFSIYAADFDMYYANWFFQFVFAATASTIVSGAVAERTKFGAYLCYSMFITGFVYPVVSHWGWGGGWLSDATPFNTRDANGNCILEEGSSVEVPCMGYADFAGSGIVHCVGGAAALMGAIFLGPRTGRYDDNGNLQHLPGHSVPIASLGGFILFLGFLAFNGGSQLAIVSGTGGNDGEVVALAFMNTILGGAGGALFALGVAYLIPTIKNMMNKTEDTAYWSLLTCINGALAGMVAMCAGCNILHPGAAFGIGGIAGLTLYWVSICVKKLGVDDPLDAFAVHYGGGVCGVLLTPIFANGAGFLVENHFQPAEMQHRAWQQWCWNFIGLLAITAWTCVLTGLVFFLLKFLGLFRIDVDTEVRGLDIAKHGEPAYPTTAYGHGWDKEGDYEMKDAPKPEHATT